MRKRSASLHERDSELLLRSRITDLNTHLRIIVAPEEDNATDGKLSQLSKSAISMNYDKPVMFVFDGGARTEFWTKGYLHCPWDAAVRIKTPNRDTVHYNDSDGVSHRVGGPAEVTYILDPREERYEEFWRVDGKQHRMNGPSSTIITRSRNNTKTWGELLDIHNWKQYHHKFPSKTPVKYSETADQRWFRNGNPYNADNAPTAIQETGIADIMQLSSMFGVKHTKLCIRREYQWRNENDLLHRINGPAIIKLLGAYDVTRNGKVVKSTYDSMIMSWYYEGKVLDADTIESWIEENSIQKGKEPYIENSYFASPEDETCFIVDVISKLI